MTILALDPGPARSALVCLGPDGQIVKTLPAPNDIILGLLTGVSNSLYNIANKDVLVIEQVESYGMPVGREVFDTVFWAGRFAECWKGPWVLLPRKAVKLHLCGSVRANDASIRQALIDKYGPGREKAIGRKASPGPLFGVKADLWAALALGLTYLETEATHAA